MKKAILGVIGGLGPMATARFLERVVQMTDAQQDQDHVDMILNNFPSIPDRTGYILGTSSVSPLPGLVSSARGLERQGVRCIAMPCVTAHYFHKELQNAVAVPVLDAVADAVTMLQNAGAARAGILATDGSIRSGLLTRALENGGINPILPSRERQKDVMHLIYANIKAGLPVEENRFLAAYRELMDCGSDVVILGCTELSLLPRELLPEGTVLDVLDVLARESVLRCGKKLKAQYCDLLKGVTPIANQHSGIPGRNSKACAG